MSAATAPLVQQRQRHQQDNNQTESDESQFDHQEATHRLKQQAHSHSPPVDRQPQQEENHQTAHENGQEDKVQEATTSRLSSSKHNKQTSATTSGNQTKSSTLSSSISKNHSNFPSKQTTPEPSTQDQHPNLNQPMQSTSNSNNQHHKQSSSRSMDSQQMHVCRLCDKLLSSSSSLDRHMLTHSGERPFVCKRCHMTFTTNGNMHRHMRTHLHKDSIARQQQEQQLKSLVGTSLSTNNPPIPATSHHQTLSNSSNTTSNSCSGNNNDILHSDQIVGPTQATIEGATASSYSPVVSSIDQQNSHILSTRQFNQRNHQDLTQSSSVSALLNQQLVAACFNKQQPLLNGSGKRNFNADLNNKTATTCEREAAFLTTLAQQRRIPSASASVSDQQHQLSNMAESQAANFLRHQQLDPKSLMLGALQGDQLGLESVKAVMLAAAAAAAAAAAVSQQQQQQHHQLQPTQCSFSNPLVDNFTNSGLDSEFDEISKISTSNTQQKLREKRRKQVNPRSTRSVAHQPATSIASDYDSDNDSRSTDPQENLLYSQQPSFNEHCENLNLTSQSRLNNIEQQDGDEGENPDLDDTLFNNENLGQPEENEADQTEDDDTEHEDNNNNNNKQDAVDNADDDEDDIVDDEGNNHLVDNDNDDDEEDEDEDSKNQLSPTKRMKFHDTSNAASVKREVEDFNNNSGITNATSDLHIKQESNLEDQTQEKSGEDEELDINLNDDENNDDDDDEGDDDDEDEDDTQFTSRMNLSITSEDDASLSSEVNMNLSDSNNNNSSNQNSLAPFTLSQPVNTSDQTADHTHLTSLANTDNDTFTAIYSSQQSNLLNPLTTVNGEVIEDISQSYVKTANPNAARKGGKRNRHCYKCKLCTYSSVDRCTLVRHLRIHSGERPYICGICRYAFTTKANCERHVRKRHKKQYNSLGGAGGGGVKGSNGGGRSLIITDHSNHQTIPVKVNPVAAQTISQTLQRIQEKQQNSVEVGLDNIERISSNDTRHQTQTNSQQHVAHQQQQLNSIDNRINKSVSKSKKRLRSEESQDNHMVPYPRQRLSDKQDVFGIMQSSSRKGTLLVQNDTQNSSNLLFNTQSGSFIDQAPEVPSTNELFVNIMAQLQQVQREPVINNNIPQVPTTLQSVPNVASATFLASMLASGKNIGTVATSVTDNSHRQTTRSLQRSLLSPKNLSQHIAQFRNLNSQTPYFIRRNPFDPFNPVDLAAQALDLSCKFQSSK